MKTSTTLRTQICLPFILINLKFILVSYTEHLWVSKINDLYYKGREGGRRGEGGRGEGREGGRDERKRKKEGKTVSWLGLLGRNQDYVFFS